MREIGRREGGKVRMSGEIWKGGVKRGEEREREREREREVDGGNSVIPEVCQTVWR